MTNYFIDIDDVNSVSLEDLSPEDWKLLSYEYTDEGFYVELLYNKAISQIVIKQILEK